MKIGKEFGFETFDFDIERRQGIFRYRISFEESDDLLFEERLRFPEGTMREVPEQILQRLLRQVHLALGVSYYKLYCPPVIETSYDLTELEAQYWSTVYRKGLGEFLYRNDLPLNRVPRFSGKNPGRMERLSFPSSDRSLVGIGGGKDSVVVAELLKKDGHEVASYILETQKPSSVIGRVAEEVGGQTLTVRRELDAQLFEEQVNSFNGHIPISAVYAWVGLLTAALYDYRYVVVGNEYSSSFGNLEYQGEEINHQWSKSAEHELLLQGVLQEGITNDMTYYSLLRPFHELRIVREFRQWPQYWPLFSSCNRNFKVHKERTGMLWCGECPKCAFAFAMMAAWWERDELVDIFGKDLLEDESLHDMYRDLLGLGEMKPFDCVGTFEETRAAFWLAREKFADSYMMRTFLHAITDGETVSDEVLRAMPSPTVPARWRFLGMETALVLGYGIEGKATEEYIKERYPELRIDVADKTIDGEEYLGKQRDFDVVVKTPGIPKELVTQQYTTATNIFMAEALGMKIGVTGTKGKSTTASLIYQILKMDGRDVRLLGNIGMPMLSALSHELHVDSISVLELSSYQLDDIEISPEVAVVLNLYEDHLDYHGNTQNYHAAKERIMLNQSPDDYFVYNAYDAKVKRWSEEAVARTVPISDDVAFVKGLAHILRGEHNVRNILAALTVARLLEVDDAVSAKAVSEFTPLPHRLEHVGNYGEIDWYDDAISTTPESTIAALQAIENVRTIFLGGLDRGYDFSDLEKVLKDSDVKNVVLFPESGDRMLTEGTPFEVLRTESMAEAVRFAYERTPSGAACLLSTASPSYSLWKNFEAQGNEFQKEVKRLASAS